MESIDHEREDGLLVGSLQFALFANVSEIVVDNGQEHAHADEDHHEDEQRERERTQEWCCTGQLLSIKLHQCHLEEHLSCVEQRRARPQFAHEHQIEERDERPEYH